MIKALIIIGILYFIAKELPTRRSNRLQAFQKILTAMATVSAIYFVLRPDDLTVLARYLGVGRGADLLLYLLTVTFVIALADVHSKLAANNRATTQLVREIAVGNALLHHKDTKGN